MTDTQRKIPPHGNQGLWIGIAGILTLVTFLSDGMGLFRMAGSTPYLLVVLMSWKINYRRSSLFSAGAVSALTVMGVLISPAEAPDGMVVPIQTLIAVWIVALLVDLIKKKEGQSISNKKLDPIIEGENDLSIYKDLVKKMPVGCVILRLADPDDIKSFLLVDANSGANIAAGFEVTSFIGHSIYERIPDLYQTEIPGTCLAALQTGEIKILGEMDYSHELIPTTTFYIRAVPISQNTVAVLYQNITAQLKEKIHQQDQLNRTLAKEIQERKETEKLLNKSFEELKETKAIADSAARTKTRFLANMSHEIRTPLNAIIGFGHLIAHTELTSTQQEYFAKIVSSAKALLAVVNDILDLSSIETKKVTLQESEFDLEEVFQKLGDGNSFLAETKGLELIMGIDSHVPTKLVGDPVRLGQILSNLCSNAIKFTNSGEVAVNATLVETIDGKANIQFEVSDTGQGMKPKFVKSLFELLGQEDDSASRKFGGSGLGLSIVKALVELMGGKIWAKSEYGKGSQFRVSLWFKKQSKQRKIEPSLDLRRLKVLVAEDNKSSRKVLEDALKSFDFEVTTSSSGEEAIELLKRDAGHTTKVVLLDSKMSGMDGIQTAQKIRKTPGISKIPIIILCNDHTQEEILIHKQRLVIEKVLVKPFRYSKLYNAIAQLVLNGNGSNGKKQALAPESEFRKELTDRKLLLVEDNEINQDVAVELLKSYGFHIDTAANGKEAVRKIFDSGSPSRYDLVLMDLQMPVMDGFEATQKIREQKVCDSLPIIAMTADVISGFREKCLEVGMQDYIAKPIDPDKMIDVISKWLKAQPGPSHDPAGANRTPDNLQIPAMENVDTEDGLKRVAGNTGLYLKLLKKFLQNHQGFIAEWKEKIQLGSEESKRAIHSLKGAAGNLGMTRLHGACKDIENIIVDGKDDLLGSGLQSLEQELKAILRELKASLTDNAEAQQPRVTLEEVRAEVDQLVELLGNHDAEALAQFEKIGILEGYEQTFEQVGLAIKEYDYDKALSLLRDVKG